MSDRSKRTSDLLKVHEVEEILGIGESLVRRLFDEGKLQGYRLPGRGDRRITRESVDRLLSEMYGEPEPIGEKE